MGKKKNTTQPKASPSADGRDEMRTSQIDAPQLAMLAALLDPKARQAGEVRSALFHAIAFLEQSVTLCEQMGELDTDARLLFVCNERTGNSGAEHLLDVLQRRCVTPLMSEAFPRRPIEMSFDEAVRRITGMRRLERAMPAFRKWIATSKRVADVGKELGRLRREMTTVELANMSEVFPRWYQRHRSEVNKTNAKKRKPTAKKNLQKKAKKSLDGKTPWKK